MLPGVRVASEATLILKTSRSGTVSPVYGFDTVALTTS